MAEHISTQILSGADVDIPFRLSSSALTGGTYNPSTEELVLDLTDGTSHSYSCDAQTVLGLLQAGSAGAYFNRFIK
jgi:hypothetical protein